MSKIVKGKTLADFKNTHDRNTVVPNKIRAALAAMLQEGGNENWDYEGEFIKRAGVSQTDIGLFRDQFSEHVIEAPRVHGKSNVRRVWFADRKVAAKARGE